VLISGVGSGAVVPRGSMAVCGYVLAAHPVCGGPGPKHELTTSAKRRLRRHRRLAVLLATCSRDCDPIPRDQLLLLRPLPHTISTVLQLEQLVPHRGSNPKPSCDRIRSGLLPEYVPSVPHETMKDVPHPEEEPAEVTTTGLCEISKSVTAVPLPVFTNAKVELTRTPVHCPEVASIETGLHETMKDAPLPEEEPAEVAVTTGLHEIMKSSPAVPMPAAVTNAKDELTPVHCPEVASIDTGLHEIMREAPPSTTLSTEEVAFIDDGLQEIMKGATTVSVPASFTNADEFTPVHCPEVAFIDDGWHEMKGAITVPLPGPNTNAEELIPAPMPCDEVAFIDDGLHVTIEALMRERLTGMKTYKFCCARCTVCRRIVYGKMERFLNERFCFTCFQSAVDLGMLDLHACLAEEPDDYALFLEELRSDCEQCPPWCTCQLCQ